MAKTRAPLLSWSASGAIADTQVYSRWKGRPYVRQYVIPANPNTAAQQQTRNAFRYLNDLWRFMPAGAVGAWELYADNSRFTARNGWLKQNTSALRTATDLSTLVMSPPAGGGLVAEAMVVTPGAGSLTVELTAPSLPAGWTISEAWALAVPDQDPQTEFPFAAQADSQDTPPYSITLSGLDTGVVYQVGGWFHYLKADGKHAYGVALTDQGTPS